MAQVMPELRTVLHGGYAVALPPNGGTGGGWRRGDEWAQLRPGGAAARRWVELLDAAAELVEANEGVPLAPRATFPARQEAGVLTVVTDASGVDGVGGYAFIAGRETELWVVSELWPSDVQEALTRAATTRREREAERRSRPAGDEAPTLSMPAAELFGIWAVAQAVAEAAAGRPTAVVSIGDCQPAAAA
eukprot:3909366-Pleurochrysis_carterae.AAC.1